MPRLWFISKCKTLIRNYIIILPNYCNYSHVVFFMVQVPVALFILTLEIACYIQYGNYKIYYSFINLILNGLSVQKFKNTNILKIKEQYNIIFAFYIQYFNIDLSRLSFLSQSHYSKFALISQHRLCVT